MNAHGSMIEVYPERATLDIPPNYDQEVFDENTAGASRLARSMRPRVRFHCQPEEIERVGARDRLPLRTTSDAALEAYSR